MSEAWAASHSVRYSATAECSFCQHYYDSHGVARIYQMSLNDGVWKLWREASGLVAVLHWGVLWRRQGDQGRLGGVVREGRGGSVTLTWTVCGLGRPAAARAGTGGSPVAAEG